MKNLNPKKFLNEDNKPGCYLVSAFFALIIVVIVKIFWPTFIPFDLFQFWLLKGSIIDALGAAWPLLLWGAGITTLAARFSHNTWDENMHAERNFSIGIFESAFAGIFEEISFRWVLFYSAIIGAQVINYFIFGEFGFGVEQWFYTNVAGPVVNTITFGILQPQLLGFSWAVGVAILVSNGEFQDGHKYLGRFGYWNSWVCGMVFFAIMFNYGLIASIIIHALYDALIFFVIYIDSVRERARDYA